MRNLQTITPFATVRWLNTNLPLVILVGLALNGLAVTVANALKEPAGPSLLLGLSPFQLATLLAAVTLIARGASRLPRNAWIETLVVLLALVPSSAVSWGALALYAAYLVVVTKDAQRFGALLFAGLAGTSLWSAVAMNWLATPITSFEALMVANLLAFAVPDVSWSGNVVGPTGGFKLILLPACASADLVPKAILALAALVALFGGTYDRRFLKLATTAALLLVLGNWLRLAGMAISAENYELVHGPIGANLFDLYQTVLIIAAAYFLIDEAEDESHA
jgi:hypothetical protein